MERVFEKEKRYDKEVPGTIHERVTQNVSCLFKEDKTSLEYEQG